MLLLMWCAFCRSLEDNDSNCSHYGMGMLSFPPASMPLAPWSDACKGKNCASISSNPIRYRRP